MTGSNFTARAGMAQQGHLPCGSHWGLLPQTALTVPVCGSVRDRRHAGLSQTIRSADRWLTCGRPQLELLLRAVYFRGRQIQRRDAKAQTVGVGK